MARKGLESAVGVFFPKIGGLCGFKNILVMSNPSKTESGLILPKEPALCAELFGFWV